MRKRSLMFMAAGAVVGGILAAGTVAVAQSSDDEVIHACVNNLTDGVRIVEADADCRALEHEEQWSKTGPEGPAGPQGPAGPAGPPGPGAEAACPSEEDLLAASGSVDGFARFDGIKGDSTDTRHKDEVDLRTLRAGATRGSAALCGASELPVFDQMTLRKDADPATVPLIEHASRGLAISEVEILLERAPTDFVFYEILLEDVFVDRTRMAWQQGEPIEEIVLSFGRITTSFTSQQADGSANPPVEFCWDIANQAEC